MSVEMVEQLDRAFKAVAARPDDLSPFFALYNPNVELYVSPSGVETGTWRGADAVIQYWTDLYAAWHSVRSELDELIDLGDSVLAVVTVRARNRQSEITLDQKVATRYCFTGDSVTRLEYYFAGKAEALEAIARGA